ncbi:unnamed protein product [Pleuronectes platessa]|uniref:Uncharacterized protein n=1 Tax=Pleuronectes platessa TaxID=8262 RepID=A0A9N7U9W0_PLEPL|nr:unnamed protein product [Pleuronectes platessa]
MDIAFGAPSYEYQPQMDITLDSPSIQMIETTEDEAPAASEAAARKEQVRPEESVSCVTENFQAFMTDLSQEELDLFAELCQHLSTVEVQSLTNLSTSVSFRSLLVKHCQPEFRKNRDSEGNYQKSGFCLEPVRDVYWGAVPKVLAEKAMHCCIRRLLQKGDRPSLETLCELLQLFQQDLEVVTSKEVMDSYYNQLDFIAVKGKRARMLSLLLKHTADSRK